ncbi:MAG: rRNA pseudouridine synthase, partial [Planctomycetes bacterium]|nr:rRNA pseudouridine synthase [Planctomycetota bacterium]
RDPTFWVDVEKDEVRVRGKTVSGARKIAIALHKPRGIVTTRRDERGRPTVFHLVPPEVGYVFPVGRLDMDSEGLLILTNDSILGERLTSPEAAVPKTYHVLVPEPPSRQKLRLMTEGIADGGDLLAAARAKLLGPDDEGAWIEVVLTEGKNREVRRLCAGVGLEVLRLVRVRIGEFALGDLAPGKWRKLSQAEVAALALWAKKGRRTR